VLAKQIVHYRQQRLCFYYSKDRHIIKNCPIALIVKPDHYTTIIATASSPKPRIKEVEDSSNSKAGEGKDKLSL
jgi:hypothetical protein